MNHHAPLLRGSALWLLVTAVATGTARLVASEALALRHGVGSGDLETALARVCAAVVLGCLAWGWLVTSAVLAEAVAGVRHAPAVPAAVRRTVLTACGLALVGGLAAPAGAAGQVAPDADAGGPDPVEHGAPAVLDGLPLPDRALDLAGPARRPRTPAPRSVTVRSGETLWAIAARSLPPSAGPTAVAARVATLHEHNRAVIGPDPDLIHPGQRLRLPR